MVRAGRTDFSLCYRRRDMTVFALIATLLIEQLRPLGDRSRLLRPLLAARRLIERNTNAGERRHGVIAWLLAVPPLLAGVLALHFALLAAHPLLAWAWNVAILYLTLGFRQFSHHFTDIHRALIDADLPRARRLIGAWRGRPADDLNSAEVARLAIEAALEASHRHVFGVLFWFAVLPGPAGAVLYPVAYALARAWGREPGAFGDFARRAFAAIDYVPVRLTATGFAIVGNFEDAVACWRDQAARWRDPEMGIVLASGAGALGVLLGMPIRTPGADGASTDAPPGPAAGDARPGPASVASRPGPAIDDRATLGCGEEADAGFLSSTVGLVWRALVLWLLLLALLGIARWVS
jgi:adenosylcobinamide-phosphate synthase